MSRWSQRTPNRRPCAVQTGGPPPVQASPSPLWRGLARSITHVLRVLACFASKQPRSQAFNLPLPGNTNAGHATHTNCQNSIPDHIILLRFSSGHAHATHLADAASGICCPRQGGCVPNPSAQPILVRVVTQNKSMQTHPDCT